MSNFVDIESVVKTCHIPKMYSIACLRFEISGYLGFQRYVLFKKPLLMTLQCYAAEILSEYSPDLGVSLTILFDS